MSYTRHINSSPQFYCIFTFYFVAVSPWTLLSRERQTCRDEGHPLNPASPKGFVSAGQFAELLVAVGCKQSARRQNSLLLLPQNGWDILAMAPLFPLTRYPVSSLRPIRFSVPGRVPWLEQLQHPDKRVCWSCQTAQLHYLNQTKKYKLNWLNCSNKMLSIVTKRQQFPIGVTMIV